MEAVLARALAGSAGPDATDAEPWGTPQGGGERALWWRAGAWAIYRQAGSRAVAGLAPPPPAAAEERRLCPPAAAALLAELAADHEHKPLLLEALGRLDEAGACLPAALLPVVLDAREHALQRALLPVLGARGRWLAGFREAWAWARADVQVAATALPELERRWREGLPAERVAVIAQVRALEPATALSWLVEALPREKADARLALLEAQAGTWTPADESFLEGLLVDRAAAVRQLAMDVLATFPGSALAGRMRARLEALGAPGRVPDLPEACPKDWVRDGFAAQPPLDLGPRAWWLQQLVGFAPLDLWSAGPAATVALCLGAEHAHELLGGLARAAARQQAHAWAEPLADALASLSSDGSLAQKTGPSTARFFVQPLLPLERLEDTVLQNLRTRDALAIHQVASALGTRWSERFATAWLADMRDHFATVGATNYQPYFDARLQLLEQAPLFLPPVALRATLAALDEVATANPNVVVAMLRQPWQRCRTTLRLRTRIHEEIV